MTKDPVDAVLEKQLDYLKLPYCKENFRSLAAEANAQHWSHLDYLTRLVEGKEEEEDCLAKDVGRKVQMIDEEFVRVLSIDPVGCERGFGKILQILSDGRRDREEKGRGSGGDSRLRGNRGRMYP
ncbi:MAG: hypothetical protein JO232_04090 [Verrucomicrobia bacterium]|nr:hypothetical protein [Verrucomicrobiota bacterium]